jgi:hypothetical protein
MAKKVNFGKKRKSSSRKKTGGGTDFNFGANVGKKKRKGGGQFGS